MVSGAARSSWKDCLEVAAKSDIGLRRYNNQDAHAEDLAGSEEAFSTRGHLFLVADGMGAHAAGETASKKAAEVIPLAYRKCQNLSPPEALREAVLAANREIFQCAEANENFRGMGTTVSALVVLASGAWVAQVGDSRVYRCRGSQIEQLSQDHSLAWELGRLPEDIRPQYVPKNIITRSLGPQMEVEVDIEGPFHVQPGDVFVLCTDGLSGQVSDEEIGQIVRALPHQEAVDALVNLAILRGGPDNITVVVVVHARPNAQCTSATEEGNEEHSAKKSKVARLVGLACTVMGCVALGAGIIAWTIVRLPHQALGWFLFIVPALLVLAGLYLLTRSTALKVRMPPRTSPAAPYRVTDCSFRRETLDELLRLIHDLDKAAREENLDLDWDQFERLKTSAVNASDDRLAEAIAAACRAINHVMERSRQQKKGGPSPQDTNFYREL